jgi:energy-coupling factor transporter ATP-binding protein EcfA2
VRISEIADISLDDSELTDDILDGLVHNAPENQEVRLVSVCELDNINNLKDGSNLDFKSVGITVIYGHNGAGKSGYSRIIKKCCRSRDKEAEILRNIHNPSNNNQSAKIKYEVCNTAEEHIWSNHSVSPTELQMVHVFDRTSGEVFLSKDADIQYKPSGMDILDRLAEVLPKISAELQTRSNNLQISELTHIFQNEYAETEAIALCKA